MAAPALSVSEMIHLADRDERERLRQNLLVTSSTVIALLGLLWGLIYLYVGAVTAAAIPLAYAFVSFASIGYYAMTGRYHLFRFLQLLITLVFPFLLMLSLGGFITSSGVVLWSLTSPIGALLFADRRQAGLWFLGFLGLVLAGALIDTGSLGFFLVEANTLSPDLLVTFFAMNFIGVSVVVFLLLSYFTRERDRIHDLLLFEQARSEGLLLNVLPAPIAARLKDGQDSIAECFESATVIFADVVGFTPLADKMGVEKTVEFLNDLLSGFDGIIGRCGLEKIRTIGDGYMAAAGVPTPRPDHAQAVAEAALEMLELVSRVRTPDDGRIHVRIGINSGTVMAGVIGRRKFTYDIWGDPVNVASRMESHGVADRIQISQRTYELIKDAYVCEPRGEITIKGKGPMPTWFLVGRKAEAAR